LPDTRIVTGALTLAPIEVSGTLLHARTVSGALVTVPVTMDIAARLLVQLSGAITLAPVQVSGSLSVPDTPGSCLATDAPSGTVEVEDGPAFGALAVDAESGSVTIGDQAI
jgi:hypothetical protein